MEFSYTQTDMFGKPEKTYNLSTNNLVLGDILQDFEMFLRGCGFQFDGTVDIVDENRIDPEPEGIEVTEDMVKAMAEQHSKFFYDTERNK